MIAVVVTLAVSTIVTAFAAPLVRSSLIRSGRMDVPNARSSHTVPTPRGGGLACLIGVGFGVAAAQAVDLDVPYIALSLCLLLAVVGLLDDRFTLDALPRLVGQVLLGAIAGWSTGVPALWLVGALLFPVVVNATNFMDGINGITGMVTLVWGLTAAYLASVHGVDALAVVGLLAAGAALGFLPFNAPRARLFLGDVGSYLFGSLAAAGITIGVAAGIPLIPLVAPLALYLVDVFVTLFRRLRARQSLTTAHRDHIYQRLTIHGLEHIQVSAIMFGLSAGITFSWIFLRPVGALALTLLAVTSYVMLPAIQSWRRVQRV